MKQDDMRMMKTFCLGILTLTYLLSPYAFAGRTLTALVSPYSEPWYDQTGEAVWFECSLSNISSVQQNVQITAQSAASATVTSVNALGTCTSPCALPQLPDSGISQVLQTSLDPGASNSFYWRKDSTDPSSLIFPRRLIIEVAEDRGAIIGSCVHYYRNNSGPSMRDLSLNGSRPF